MKSRLLLISTLFAATAGLGVSTAQSSEPDAQAQAAALLSSSYVTAPAQVNASSQSVASDAQAQAAALLSGTRVRQHANESTSVAPSQSLDAQAHAAALLGGVRPTVNETPRTTATAVLGDHPAVVVARTRRSIDPNTFIVAHPARLQLISTPSDENPEALATAAAKVSGAAGR